MSKDDKISRVVVVEYSIIRNEIKKSKVAEREADDLKAMWKFANKNCFDPRVIVLRKRSKMNSLMKTTTDHNIISIVKMQGRSVKEFRGIFY